MKKFFFLLGTNYFIFSFCIFPLFFFGVFFVGIFPFLEKSEIDVKIAKKYLKSVNIDDKECNYYTIWNGNLSDLVFWSLYSFYKFNSEDCVNLVSFNEYNLPVKFLKIDENTLKFCNFEVIYEKIDKKRRIVHMSDMLRVYYSTLYPEMMYFDLDIIFLNKIPKYNFLFFHKRYLKNQGYISGNTFRMSEKFSKIAWSVFCNYLSPLTWANSSEYFTSILLTKDEEFNYDLLDFMFENNFDTIYSREFDLYLSSNILCFTNKVFKHLHFFPNRDDNNEQLKKNCIMYHMYNVKRISKNSQIGRFLLSLEQN